MLYSGKVVVFWQVSCYCAKVVVFGQIVFLGQKWLYMGKSGCFRVKVSVFWAKVVVLGRSGCFWENVVVIRQGSCNRAMCLYSGKCGCIRAKWLYWGRSGCNRKKIGCIRAKWLYPTNVVVFGQSGYFWKKGVVLGQK